MATTGRIYEALVRYFQEDGWQFSPLEDRSAVLLSANVEHGVYTCYAQAREEHEQLIFYVMYAVKAPEQKRVAAMEYVTRANYGLLLGNFELDLSDGEVRYKTSINVQGELLTSGLIRPLVATGLAIADRYLPGYLLLLYSHVSAEDAIREIEG